MKLQLVTGYDKSVSISMSWFIEGYDGRIERYQNGNPNASSASQKRVKWSAVDFEGTPRPIPENVKKHEVSIAKWLVVAFPDTSGSAKANLSNFLTRLDKFLFDAEVPLSHDPDALRIARVLRNEIPAQRENINLAV